MTPLKSIVVPCYNESANLPTLIARFAALWTPGSDWELVLVNNGSTDDSAAVFTRELAIAGRSFVRVVTVPSPNVGYGHGIMTGLRAAQGEFLAFSHADMQCSPEDVFAAYALLRKQRDPSKAVVKGQRARRGFSSELVTTGM